jgi:pSer/pThr/pTyr-binding forkhead associated (FHA) protein
LTIPETRGRTARHATSPASSYIAPLAILLVRSGGMAGQRLPVRQPVTTIGSGKHADLVLPDPGVTPLHARLELRQGVWILTTLRNAHPVQVDGERVTGEVPLSPGSTILLGGVGLLFEPRDPVTERPGRAEPAGIPDPGRPRGTGLGLGRALAILLGLALIAGGILLEVLP